LYSKTEIWSCKKGENKKKRKRRKIAPTSIPEESRKFKDLHCKSFKKTLFRSKIELG